MKFVKEFVIPAAVLTVICVVVSAALVFTYDTTKPIIEAAKIAEADAARAVVLAGGKNFEAQKVTVDGVVDAYKSDAGYVITAKSKGYGGDLYVMVGIKSDGTIDTVKLMENNETPGLGSQVGEDKYTGKYKGKDGNEIEGIDAISGSTVSSYAFRFAVQLAFEQYGELAGVTFEEPKSPEQMAYPGVDTFEEFTLEGAEKAFKAGDGVVIVTKGSGYSGATTNFLLYTGIGPDGKITGVYMGENTETPGLGSKVNDESYRSQYVGKDNVDSGIDAISGATETSDGFLDAVKEALELFKTMNSGAEAPAESGESAPAEESAPVESGVSQSEAPAESSSAAAEGSSAAPESSSVAAAS